MKVKAVINKHDLKLNNTNMSAILSAVVIFAGVVSGVLLYAVSDKSVMQELYDHFIHFTENISNKNNPEIFSGLVLQNAVYCIFMLIFSLCVYGTPAVLFLSFIKTMGLGLLTTSVYDLFALKGIEYCLLVFFPGKIILILAMVMFTQNCYVNSLCITRSLKAIDERGVSLKKFILRTIVILTIVALSGVVDFVALILFSSLFEFV